MSLSRRLPFFFAAACFLLSLGGCSGYFAQREMESTLEAWIGSSPTTEKWFAKPFAIAVIKRDAIDTDSPLAEAMDSAVARLHKSGIGYSMQVSGKLFELKSANDDRMIFRRQGESLTVRIGLADKKTPDAIEIAVSPLEFSD
jgi:hypothetical protein